MTPTSADLIGVIMPVASRCDDRHHLACEGQRHNPTELGGSAHRLAIR